MTPLELLLTAVCSLEAAAIWWLIIRCYKLNDDGAYWFKAYRDFEDRYYQLRNKSDSFHSSANDESIVGTKDDPEARRRE